MSKKTYRHASRKRETELLRMYPQFNTGDYAPYAKTPLVQYAPLLLTLVYLFFFLRSSLLFLVIYVHNIDKYHGRKK